MSHMNTSNMTEEQQELTRRVKGKIISRRVLGKHLAFCNIEIIPLPSTTITTTTTTITPRNHRYSEEQPSETMKMEIESDVTAILQCNNRSKHDDDDHHHQHEHEDKNGNNNGGQVSIMNIAFRRKSNTWDQEHDSTFPTTNSDLAFGSIALFDLVHVDQGDQHGKEEQRRLQSTKKKPRTSWEVKSWELLLDAKKQAETFAREASSSSSKDGHGDEYSGGISCSKYLELRKSFHFDALNKQKKNESLPKRHADKKDDTVDGGDESSYDPTALKEPSALNSNKNVTQNSTLSSLPSSQLSEGQYCHGDKKAKAARSKLFASWIIDQFGEEYLQQGPVLDIAGGKGQLSIELAAKGKVSCIVIDPLLRRKGTNQLRSTDKKRIQQVNAPLPQHISKPFNNDNFLEYDECISHVMAASCLIGLHADECTEDIVDVALRFNKPMAIVPCCVFPKLFSTRRLKGCGTLVRSYDQFVQYLMEKDKRLRLEILQFDGRNQVIFLPSNVL